MATAAADNTEPTMPPRNATRQESYSGTPRGPDGLTTPDDYVRDLMDPLRRMELFEEMRQSDDAVKTAIEARRQEINAANWLLSSDDDSDRGREILEFCEDNIYPLLDDLLRLLGGGALAYGFAAVEPVYAWSDEPFAAAIGRGKVRRATKGGERRIYLRKLAHIRQTSVVSFRISETGELLSLLQHTYNGRSFRQVDVPGEKLLIWTYDKQGDDFWGVPPARSCYKAWKFKTQIERLNLMHIDKFGVGTPVVEEGEGWSQPERDRVAAFLGAWRSGASNYIMHPLGGKITVISDEGKTTVSTLEWVKYYNLAIAKTYLTHQTELGSTETGARSLGETFYEQLGGIVQADCEALASLINNQLIVPLVRWNFGPQDTYPTFAPSQRVRAGTAVATVIKSLIDAKVVHPRPEDEAWLRDAFGMPTVEIETLEEEVEERDAKAAEIAKLQPAAADPAAPGAPNPPIKIAASARALGKAARAEGAPDPASPGTSYRTREYSEWEQTILRPDVLLRDLDIQATRLTGEVQDVLAEIDRDLETQAKKAAAAGAANLSAAVREISVSTRLRTKLRTVMLEAARRARDYGAIAVRNEIQRQADPDGIGPQRAPTLVFPMSSNDPWPRYGGQGEAPGFYRQMMSRMRALIAGQDEKTARDLHLEAEVDRAVEEELDRREQSTRSSVLNALAQAAGAAADVLTSIVSTAVSGALLGLSTGRTQSNVQGVVNVGFGIGRSDQADAILDAAAQGGGRGGRSGLVDENGKAIELVSKIYSSVMDLGTCDECAKWDGGVFPIEYPEDYTGVQAPNPRCFGGYSRCRCAWIYVTDEESVPSLPASKGPQSISIDVAKITRELTAAADAAIARHLDQLKPAERAVATEAIGERLELHVHVDAGAEVKPAVVKTIRKNGDGSFTVTEGAK